jgi:hypothetical protein
MNPIYQLEKTNQFFVITISASSYLSLLHSKLTTLFHPSTGRFPGAAGAAGTAVVPLAALTAAVPATTAASFSDRHIQLNPLGIWSIQTNAPSLPT